MYAKLQPLQIEDACTNHTMARLAKELVVDTNGSPLNKFVNPIK